MDQKGRSNNDQTGNNSLFVSRPTDKTKLWLIIKFCMLFVLAFGFISYNFGGMLIGLPVAAVLTALAIAQWRIFDAASDALFDVREEDRGEEKAKKVTETAAKRIFYSVLDYSLAGLSIALVLMAKKYDLSYLTAVAAMWLLIDLPTSAIFVSIYERTGRDMTLGRSYRRMADTILEHSRIAGVIVFLYEITLASFWSGADYTVIFFKDELKTQTKMITGIICITAIHAILWTAVYWYGSENIADLIRFLVKG